ncbi:MAG: 5'-nucleotidase C-terminal domain-containing protein [Spirochaetes bacterium]|nr:5'-nucleotidase C-terminal domain-containing protein [Spirochaetota bacterium]
MKTAKILLLLLLINFSAYSANKNEIELTILFTNDTNGHPLSFSHLGRDNQGGIPARASLIKKIQREKRGNNFLILDTGGIIRGMPESNLFNGETDIAGMNACDYFASGVGISEIYESIDFFNNLNKKANFYFISSNIEDRANAKAPICDSYIIKKIGGLNGIKVGIFSVITQDAIEQISERAKEEIVFKDPIESARSMVEILKSEENDADIIIALTYLGYYPNDEKTGSRTLASSVSGIDLIIDGRTGHKIDQLISINNTKIAQAYRWGLYLGEINLKIEDKKIISFEYRLHPVNFNIYEESQKISEDLITLNTIKTKMISFNKELKKTIVILEGGEFTTDKTMTAETPIGNLICDAMIDFTKADIAFQNSGGIGEVTLKEGKLTREDINSMIRYNNPVYVLTMTGEEIINVINHSVKRIGYGSFLQVGGLNFNYSKSKDQIYNVKINGVDIKNSSSYKVAINSWLAYGGDGYDEFRDIQDKVNLNVVHKDVLAEYLKKKEKISPYTGNRIVITD